MSEEGQAAEKPVEEKKAPEAPEPEAKPAGDGARKPAAAPAAPPKAEETPAPGNPADETLKLPAEEMVKRRSRWQSSLAAWRYVNSVSKDNEVKVRDTDRATSAALFIVSLAALLALVVPFDWMVQHRVPFV